MIKVAGYNAKCLYGNSNKETEDGYKIISPPVKSNLEVSDLLCYSIYCYHSIWITKDGHAYAIGDNIEKQIYESIPKQFIECKTEIILQDDDRNHYIPISAVCGRFYSLFLVKSDKDSLKLIYSHSNKGGRPIFLNIGDKKPIALYGGMTNSAVITEDNSIILITKSVTESPNDQVKTLQLPDKEIPIFVACCDDYFFVLSKSGQIYQYRLLSYKPSTHFTHIKEIKDKHFKFISGTFKNCFAVTDDGDVYAKGSNDHGKLGLGKERWGTDRFKKIKSLSKIKAVYAGCFHTLFQTEDDVILGLGWNRYGELFIDIDPDNDSVYKPTQTSLTKGVTFCTVGDSSSAIYVGCEPPDFSPNQFVTEKNHMLPKLPTVNVALPKENNPKSDESEYESENEIDYQSVSQSESEEKIEQRQVNINPNIEEKDKPKQIESESKLNEKVEPKQKKSESISEEKVEPKQTQIESKPEPKKENDITDSYESTESENESESVSEPINALKEKDFDQDLPVIITKDGRIKDVQKFESETESEESVVKEPPKKEQTFDEDSSESSNDEDPKIQAREVNLPTNSKSTEIKPTENQTLKQSEVKSAFKPQSINEKSQITKINGSAPSSAPQQSSPYKLYYAIATIILILFYFFHKKN